MISSVLEANKMKKNATMLKRFLPDEFSSNASILFICFSDYLTSFRQVVCLCAVKLYNSQSGIWIHIFAQSTGDAIKQTETFLGEFQECCAFLK